MGFRDLVIKGFKIEWCDQTHDFTEKLTGDIIFKAMRGDFKFICKTSREELSSYNQDALNAWEGYVAREVLNHYSEYRQRHLDAFRAKGEHLYIIIHRSEVVDIQKMFEYFIASLFNDDSTIKISDHGKYIDIGTNRIDFRCGDEAKLGGVRPDYFNTDSDLASCLLQLGADKVNGKEIKGISEIINIIKGGTNGNSRSNPL